MMECHSTVSAPAGDVQVGDGVDGIATVQWSRHQPGNPDRAAQSIQPRLLVGPYIAQQRQLAVGS